MQQTALFNDILDKRRKGLGLIPFPRRPVFDHAGVEIHPDLVPCRNIPGRLVAFEDGESVTYGLFSAQERGTLFIGPGEKVYSGMVIGQNGKAEDIELNVCKSKHLTNTRASGSDDALKLTPPRILSLEQALDFIDTDELLEITPKNIRIRKKILDPTARYRAKRNGKA